MTRASTPLRTVSEREAFCDSYFAAVQARVVGSSEHYREYELPRDVDKELTDRPYYWMWVEKTGQDVPPTILRLAFTQEAQKRETERLRHEAQAELESQPAHPAQRMFVRVPTVELVALGSFRLDKICASLERRGQFACVAPQGARPGVPLIPWLLLNSVISYRCDLVEQEFLSVGVCLANGQVVEGFYGMIEKVVMSPVEPRSLLNAAAMSLEEGFDRAATFIRRRLEAADHTWAAQAQHRLDMELQQIKTYYDSLLPSVHEEERPLVNAECRRKQQELIDRTQPRIEITFKQAALVGLMER